MDCRKSHNKHHLVENGKNLGNFNVTIPGADFLYNTYN